MGYVKRQIGYTNVRPSLQQVLKIASLLNAGLQDLFFL